MKRYLGYQFKQAVEELTRKIAAEMGVRVSHIKWTAAITTAGTNSYGEVYFADVADDAVLHDIDVQRYVGFVVHEMLHQKYTDWSAKSNEEYLDQLHNAVEDAWIEHTGIDANLTGNIGGLLTALLDQMVGEANASVTDWTDPRQYPFIFAVYLRRHLNCYVPVPEGLEPIIHGAAQMIGDCKSSEDTLRVARWIMDQLQNLGQETPQNTPPKPTKTPSETQSGDGQGVGEGKGDSRLAGNPHQSPGSARAPAPGTEANEAEPTLRAPDGKAGAGSWSEDASLTEVDDHLRASWIEDHPQVSARLRYEVKRLFDNSGLEDFQRNRKSGSVNVSALHKVGLTDKLFQRRHEVEGIDSAVVICVDVSGSMFDDGKHHAKYQCSNRIIQAALTAQALIDTLQRSQVATCVLTFGSNTAVLKPFGEHATKARAKVAALNYGGNTNDYFAVRYAHKLLLNRPEQRKICFVITDGQGKPQMVREQCSVGERLGITTIGVGIELDVSGVYPQAVAVQDASDLAGVSFKQIKLAA
jgi:cobalamin biosynthesis protein CobT